MGSSRLAGKVLMKIDEKVVLEYVLEQLKFCNFIDKLIVATTKLPEDDEVVECVKNMNVDFFRGSEKNVLDRYYQCAKKFPMDIIVRITADNPLIDPFLVDLSIKTFLEQSVDYVTNCRKRTFPYGTEVEVLNFNILEHCWKNSKKPSELEHVTPYIYNNEKKFKIFNLLNNKDLSHFRWTVDHKNDLKLVKELVSKIQKRPILMKDILEIFSKEPDLKNINKKNIPDEGFLKSLKEDEDYFRSKNSDQ